MGLIAKRRERREREREERERFSSFDNMPVLNRIRPRERYIFHSDYFEIDDCVATILTYTHNDAGRDDFGPFWGINRIPELDSSDLAGVVTINFESISRMNASWINSHQSKAESIAETDRNEQLRNGTMSTRGKAESRSVDLAIIGRELNNGAAYLNVHTRLLVKAPDVDTLDLAVERIERHYTDRFATISTMAYDGDQRYELSHLFARNEKKRGKGMYATSPELAGSFSLVTHGLEDPGGEYIGMLHGEVNSSCVIFDVDNYEHHVVVASEDFYQTRNNARVADVWGAKIGQACLMNNHRVVHILMGDTDMSSLGPTFDKITTTLDLNSGDLNMFEMFGDVKDELAIFASQMQKLILMAEQAYECTDADRAIIRGSLEEALTRFYIDQRMWFDNASEHVDRLRIVGLDHNEVPILSDFVTYLNTLHKAELKSDAQDAERLHALSVLKMTFANMLTTNGDLFNTRTTSAIDNLSRSKRTVYDFSSLMRRGKGVAMAQLVNVIDLALAQCNAHDTVIFHGAQYIDKNVFKYVTEQFDKLWRRGGRIVLCYDSIESCIDNRGFNNFDTANYTVFSNMSPNMAERYKQALGQDIPAPLTKILTSKAKNIMYIRRMFDNVVFVPDLQLDAVSVNRRV